MMIRANYQLTLVEQRILLACIAKINPCEPVPEVVTLTAGDYAEIYKTKGKAAYKALKRASLVLPDRELAITDQHEEKEVMRWLKNTPGNRDTTKEERGKALYPLWEGRIILRFSDGVKPLLSGMSKNFTQYELEKVAGLQSVYSIRLYELLMNWRRKGALFITLDDFKARLGIEDQYSQIFHLKSAVIVPAVEELGQKSGLSIKWTPKRRGKAVSGLTFTFRERSKRDSKLRRLPSNL
ncbi:MAG: replication initiation protein [Candidatus Thiodiazotropha sp. (ex Lucinoma aequizonata)]|nr:replication initiation protein [Candidatus Thiodiazotropha sp. (ex Lucinoma aequizonata)]MCU7889098.1 replication initiation protein [Candidatus Thiodiazotropha sp. (ex Lucinoma aequizonata)]MCU7894200.1 replication initiation protein [Candidatus Thiodiazotropha sp. (ex Lucinoma aequizonata)]MCU7899408.1 replication initiation protein [Candidatus Thiodiazotropha sp. (ex Lucinoma aequizonata)]MCU7902505.1 replication initiation protein [Candidatus Thiodiazotropha sp. (ex Lucinoma aequizonata)